MTLGPFSPTTSAAAASVTDEGGGAPVSTTRSSRSPGPATPSKQLGHQEAGQAGVQLVAGAELVTAHRRVDGHQREFLGEEHGRNDTPGVPPPRPYGTAAIEAGAKGPVSGGGVRSTIPLTGRIGGPGPTAATYQSVDRPSPGR